MKYPKPQSKIGNDGWVNNPDGSEWHFKVIGEILHRRSDLPRQLYRLQRLQFDDKYKYEQFRLGYDIIGKKPRMKGKWIWGQYCPFIPKKDFRAIILKAVKCGWISLPKSLLGGKRRAATI